MLLVTALRFGRPQRYSVCDNEGEQMPPRPTSTSVRLVALVLVLVVGVEVLTCDFFSPGFCKVSGTTNANSADPVQSGDNCLCCCVHYIAPQPMTLAVLELLGKTAAPWAHSLPVSPAFEVYHPPRG